MSDLTSLQKYVAQQMRQVADSFIEDTYRDNLAFIGTANMTTPFDETSPSSDTEKQSIKGLVNALMNDYDGSSTNGKGFKNVYSACIKTSETAFYFRTFNSNITGYSLCNIVASRNSLKDYFGENSSNTEISLKNFVQISGSDTQTTLYNCLNKIRKLYSALDDVNYKNYVYRLSNRSANSTNAPLRIYDFNGNVVTDDATLVGDIKSYINELKGGNYSVSTATLYTSSVNNESNIISTNRTSDLSGSGTLSNLLLPKDVYGDSLVELKPTNNNNNSSNSIRIATNIEGKGTKRYISYSFYARTRNGTGEPTNSDVATFTIAMRLVLADAGGTKNINTVSNLPPVIEKTFTVTPEWQRFIMTGQLQLPIGTKVNVNVETYILHNNASNTSNHVMFCTGVQSDVQEADSNGVVPAFRPPVFDESRTNRTVVRRMLLLYELMTMYYIAAYMVDRNKWSTPVVDTYDSLLNIVYEYIMNYNRNVIRADSNTGKNFMSTLSKGVSEKIQDYNTNNKDLAVQTANLSERQYDLKGRITNMNSEKQKSSGMFTYMVVGFVIFALVAVSCIVIFALPIDRHQQITASIVTASVGVIAILIYRMIYMSRMESFQVGSVSNYLTSPTSYASGLSKSNQSNFRSGVTLTVLDFASQYLDNTINIALMIQTYSGYGEINQGLNRQRAYYYGVNSQLQNAGYKINSVQNAYTHDKYTNRARISFFVTVTLLIAISAALLAMTSSYPSAQPIILTICAIVLFLAILFYLLDTSIRVRTSANKIYWGTPNTSSL